MSMQIDVSRTPAQGNKPETVAIAINGQDIFTVSQLLDGNYFVMVASPDENCQPVCLFDGVVTDILRLLRAKDQTEADAFVLRLVEESDADQA